MKETIDEDISSMLEDVQAFVEEGEEGTPQEIIESGLLFSDSNGMLFDPATGEVISMVDPIDEPTANRAMYLLFANDAVISMLKRERMKIDAQIKTRTRRKEYFISKFRDGLEMVTNSLLAGKKKTTHMFSYGKCGFRAVRRAIDVSPVGNDELIAACLKTGLTSNLALSFDLSEIAPATRDVLIGISYALAKEKSDALKVTLHKTKVSNAAAMELAKELPAANVKGVVQGGVEFYISTNSGGTEE